MLIVPEPAASSVIPMLVHTRRTGALKPSSSGLRILSMFSVAVELPLSSHAIILSLPCSSFELIPLNVATTQEHWGSDQVIFKDNKPGSSGQREASSGFPTIHQHVSFTFCVLPLLIDLTAYTQLTS